MDGWAVAVGSCRHWPAPQANPVCRLHRLIPSCWLLLVTKQVPLVRPISVTKQLLLVTKQVPLARPISVTKQVPVSMPMVPVMVPIVLSGHVAVCWFSCGRACVAG